MSKPSQSKRPDRLFKRALGHKFVFNYDPSDPTQLHITVRHMGTVEDAITTFFDGDTTPDPKHNRFRTETEDHWLLWFWLNEADKVVMVISAGPLAGGAYSTEDD